MSSLKVSVGSISPCRASWRSPLPWSMPADAAAAVATLVEDADSDVGLTASRRPLKTF